MIRRAFLSVMSVMPFARPAEPAENYIDIDEHFDHFDYLSSCGLSEMDWSELSQEINEGD
tara:strand:- start:207 stop:386 length:180 start_codon:yes stop_codon:yes gene_type:complete